MGCTNVRAFVLDSEEDKPRHPCVPNGASSKPRECDVTDNKTGKKNVVTKGGAGRMSQLARELLPTDLKLNCGLEYASPDETIIIFDWDDTLCPSTWGRETRALEGLTMAELRSEFEEDLTVLSTRVVELLQEAQKLGQVMIVTSAARDWVHRICVELMPEASSIVQQIPVIYALELVNDAEKASWLTQSLVCEAKARAMNVAIGKYSPFKTQGWASIVSIGDSYCEHDAIRQVAQPRPHNLVAKGCRTKTVKMLDRPCLSSIVSQVAIMKILLPSVVHAERSVDIEFGAGDNNTVNCVMYDGGAVR